MSWPGGHSLGSNGEPSKASPEAATATVVAKREAPKIAITPESGEVPATASQPSSAPVMMLREWHVSHAFASYYLEPVADLERAAETLVRTGVASSAYVADGLAYWMSKDTLETHRPELNWREHENHAELNLPNGIQGWARHGLFYALLHRFSENKLMSPLPGPQHEYLRAAMEPSSLVFDDEEVIVCPTLKLYKTGVFTISYEVVGRSDVDLPDFVSRYVNLFMRWCDEAWVPHTIAKLGAATALHREAKDRDSREANLRDFILMQRAAEKAGQSVEIDDLQFKMYPAHAPLDDSVIESLIELANEAKLGRKLPPEVRELAAKMSAALSQDPPPSSMRQEAGPAASQAVDARGPQPQAEPIVTLSERPPNASPPNVENSYELATPEEHEARPSEEATTRQNNTVAPDTDPNATIDADANPDDSEEIETPTVSYQLSDMFDNAEFAIRVALDPPPDSKSYSERGLIPKLTRGGYWCSRPQVGITAFEDQPTTATEIRETFGDQLGLIMMRVSSAPQSVARAQLGESLRPFEDWTLHVNEALSLCVYARDRPYKVFPPILETTDRACLFELIDYLSMRCHQLDERASHANSAAEARVVRADLGAVENLARTGFRAGELNAATKVAWQKLELPARVKEAREKVSLAAEAASERSNNQGARFNAVLAVVFGIVGAAGLTDSFTKPLWTKLGLPLPNGLEGPACFLISAVLVGLVLWFITHVLKRS